MLQHTALRSRHVSSFVETVQSALRGSGASIVSELSHLPPHPQP